ncbi:L,D-transpeptidase family protein [Streptomyces sp. A1499]|uniref:L,D-transpeptidase family protein n=1 Tax=Streptomyces sp. A1499 TaxID=2563104 RepID=UPI00109E9B37|nr:L,D-transpeptidase family protein [Streptomyces sp. A1499]THC53138.1 murein L,D-transpeptidase [Streptomyces sp. A1499]
MVEGTVRRGVGGRAAAAVAVLALVGGCKAVAVDTEGGRPGATASGDAKPEAAATTTPGTSGARTSPESPEPPEPPASPEPPAPSTTRAAPPPKTLMAQGAQGKQVRELQARLRQIGWFHVHPTGNYGPATAEAVRGFQAKRGLPVTGRTDTVTWQRLLGMTREPARQELYSGGGMPAAKPDPRCMTGRVLCIAKSSRTLTWMIDGKVKSTMDIRLGSQYTPTREGGFKVYWKSRHHVSTLYDTPMPYAMFFSGGQAVHYSADFAARGYAGGSHGCVNVRDKGKIASLYAQVRNGDRVVIYK